MQAHFGCSRSHKWVLGSPHRPQHHHPAPHHPQHHHFQSLSYLKIYNALSSHSPTLFRDSCRDILKFHHSTRWPVVKTLLHSKLPFIRCIIHLQPSETKISEPNWPTLFWRFSVEFNNFQSQQMILDAWRAADGVLQFQSAKSNFKKKMFCYGHVKSLPLHQQFQREWVEFPNSLLILSFVMQLIESSLRQVQQPGCHSHSAKKGRSCDVGTCNINSSTHLMLINFCPVISQPSSPTIDFFICAWPTPKQRWKELDFWHLLVWWCLVESETLVLAVQTPVWLW